MKVFIGLPTYSGRPHPKMLESLSHTLAALNARGDSFVARTSIGCCYIQMARNELLYYFRTTDCDKLLWLDDDVEWNPRDALNLLDMDDDVVGATYPLKRDEVGYPVVVYTDENHRAIVREDGCIDASHVPTGFMAVSRAAIDKMCQAYPEKRYRVPREDGEWDERIDLFPQGVHAGRWEGEDIAFCRLWRELGGKIWLVPNVTMTHHGRDKSYTGNYHEFLLRQPGGSKA